MLPILIRTVYERSHNWLVHIRRPKKIRRPMTRVILVGLFLVGMSFPIVAAHLPMPPESAQQRSQVTEDIQGRHCYEAGQYAEAVELWQSAIATFKATGDRLGQAQTLSNLSLAYQQLGQWDKASQAIAQSLALMQIPTSQPERSILAQALDVQGRLQLSRGNTEAALKTWKQAAILYTQLNDSDRLTRNQINQAQALQSLGFYPQAQKKLTVTTQQLQNQPNSSLKAIGLRSLGNVLRITGNFTESRQILQQSLAVATAIAHPQAIAEAQLSLGNTAAAQQDFTAAIGFYQQAATHDLLTAVPAHLHRLDLLIETQQFEAARSLLSQIPAHLDRLPLSRSAVYARIDYAQSWIKLANPNAKPVAQMLAIALQDARRLQDVRAESYAIGTLGSLYEQTQQWTEAITLTRQALVLAQTLEAHDIAYQWQWQLGRLLRNQHDRTGAIAVYDQAVKTLQSIRYDLVTVNPDVQFSFRDKVEPVYRQFVDLLLQSDDTTEPSQDNLRQARTTIEALQLAELDNFFRTACLAPKQPLDTVVDQTASSTAVIYATILSDRLEVILKLPQQPLRHYATRLPQSQVEKTLEQLRRNIAEPLVS